MMQKRQIAIGVGSNQGDRLQFLQRAVELLVAEFLESATVSSVYESEPWGVTDQPKFLNLVVRGLSEWKPPAIVNFLQSAEASLGRSATFRWGPREIDLDLIVFEQEIWESDGVSVPHPEMLSRSFVLLPLAEIWPDWTHPAEKRTAGQLAEECLKTQPGSARKIGPLPPGTKIPSPE